MVSERVPGLVIVGQYLHHVTLGEDSILSSLSSEGWGRCKYSKFNCYNTIITNGNVMIQVFYIKADHTGIVISPSSTFRGDRRLGSFIGHCFWWNWWERLTCKTHVLTTHDFLLMPLHFCLGLMQGANIPSKQPMKGGTSWLHGKQGHGEKISGGVSHRVTSGVCRYLTCLLFLSYSCNALSWPLFWVVSCLSKR